MNPAGSPSPEAALLLASSAFPCRHNSISRIRTLAGPSIDWAEFLRLSIPHGIMPVVSRNLEAHAADLVPAASLSQFSRYRQRVAERNQNLLAELSSILGLFQQAGLPALPFKGPLLALAAYNDLSLRESHDLDIWIAPVHLERAGDILRSRGYQGAGHERGIARALVRDAGPLQTEFIHPELGHIVELHDRLQTSQFSFNPAFEQLWERRITVPFKDLSLPALAPEDHLISLCVHGSKHMWRRLSWILDLLALAHANPIPDLTATLLRAGHLHASRRLVAGLNLAKTIYPAEFAEAFESQIPTGSATRQITARIQSTILEGIENRTLLNFLSEVAHHVQSSDTNPARVRISLAFLQKTLLVDRQRMLRPMPGSTAFLYRLSAGFRSVLSRFARHG